MRAVIVNEYGGTPVLAEIPTPQPGPNQVLIKVHAAGVNPMDRTFASGAQRSEAATFPMVLGADGAGIVETIGEGATRFSPDCKRLDVWTRHWRWLGVAPFAAGVLLTTTARPEPQPMPAG